MCQQLDKTKHIWLRFLRDKLNRYELTAKLLQGICRARIICDIQLSLSSVLQGLGQLGLGGTSTAATAVISPWPLP
ncbi:unnamed protein product [Parnassius apollo]|uniref:(apollo) hypothetical protein n=1 Tax=Parnassius apollo TaxID=110799 RepID=A0A8S3XND6_PARAO|nr:unnamed protein product [Parnassius apollo]